MKDSLVIIINTNKFLNFTLESKQADNLNLID